MIYMTGLGLASSSSEISWKTTCVSKPTVEPLLGAQPLIEVPISAFLIIFTAITLFKRPLSISPSVAV